MADDPSDGEVSRIYDEAGFGRPVRRGSRPALVVVDFSYGFTDPSYPTGSEMSAAVDSTAGLLAVARAARLPIVFTTIAYDDAEAERLTWLRKAEGMAALRRGSRLVEIDHRLHRRADEALVVKTGASAFFGTNLAGYLVSARADTVVVTGATTSGCVRATVVDAVQYGFPVLVPETCVADRAEGPHRANLFDIEAKYADTADTADVADYLRSCAHPREAEIPV